MNRRNFILTTLGALAGSGAAHLKPKPVGKAIRFNPTFSARAKIVPAGYKHTILPPPGEMPLDRSAWRQYVTIDPADARHAISSWARLPISDAPVTTFYTPK
jgi:hypothetical protein